MVVLDAVRDLLQQNRLAGLWRRDDQAARAESDRAEEIDQAARRRATPVLKVHARLRIDAGEFAVGRTG